MGYAYATDTVLTQAAGLCAVNASCDPPYGRLHLALFGCREVEHLSERAAPNLRVLLRTFVELLLALLHLLYQLRQAAQDVLGLGFELLYESLVHLHLVQVIHEILEIDGRNVEGYLLATGVRHQAAGVEHVARAPDPHVVSEALQCALQSSRLAVQDKLLRE